MLSPGAKVRDYEVIAPLCAGGMAMLYIARRRGVGGFNRLVTLKIVHQHLVEDESIIKLFLDEARLLAYVAHPNVVHVEEVGACGGSYFIAMEYVHGVSVADLLALMSERRLRPRPKLCVWAAAQVAEALHAAHETSDQNGVALDIVHRDVSPQNVLISHTGHVKLIDFGIAKSYAEAGQRTGGRMVFGKLRYLSPEQLQLERADRRSDVYALGVMLWEMLAGRAFLRCQRLDDERDWATRENPAPPSEHSPDSTPELDRVVLKAIAYDASERYENAFELRSALLRAEPAASNVDAPMVAALVRSLLGDELDRRRASWPSEVAEELKVAGEITSCEVRSLDELTSDNVMNAGLSQHDGDGDGNEPTSALAGSSVPSSERPTMLGDAAFNGERSNAAHESTSVTLGVATMAAFNGRVERTISSRVLRSSMFGGGCLALGVLIGRFLLPLQPPQIAEVLQAGWKTTRADPARDCVQVAPVVASATLALSPVQERERVVDPQEVDAAQAHNESASRKLPAHYASRRGASRAKQNKTYSSTGRHMSSWSRKAHDRIIHSLD